MMVMSWGLWYVDIWWDLHWSVSQVYAVMPSKYTEIEYWSVCVSFWVRSWYGALYICHFRFGLTNSISRIRDFDCYERQEGILHVLFGEDTTQMRFNLSFPTKSHTCSVCTLYLFIYMYWDRSVIGRYANFLNVRWYRCFGSDSLRL